MSQPKPQGSIWTDDQWAAISERGSNLLVAAAAGSGKTAVLVERIIRRITDPKNPADVDRLLVATFTKAAADEMRQRIREALEQQLSEHRGDEHLARQIALINKAPISTLHAFCLEVVQTYFYKIPIDPVFRIANETEAELLQNESLEELFEDEYAKEGNESFLRLIDCFGGKRSDEPVMQLVLRLYEFSRSHPWPDHWLKETAQRFRDASESSKGLFQGVLQEVQQELEGCVVLTEAALDLCRKPGGPAPYYEALQADLEMLRALLAACESGDWDVIKQELDAFQFGRLKACRGDNYDPRLIEAAKELRNDVKGAVTGLKEEWFQRSADQYRAELLMLSPVVDVLIRLVQEFAARYAAKKQEKGLVDFNDLEHYCLAVLRDPASTPENLVPSEVALHYRERFVEVLLDEYQDTNRVQEMIVELISRETGNRFMVGDVKQSIYRFRLAEPELFLAKYRSYRTGEGGRRIDLAMNFRSRREVVDAVNFLFRQIMYESAAEIDYDDKAELRYGAAYYEEAKLPAAEETAAHAAAGGLAASPASGGGMDEEEAAKQAAAATDGEGASGSQAGIPDHAVEVLIADRKELEDAGQDEDANGTEEDGTGMTLEDEISELEAVQAEARMIGMRIAELLGQTGKTPHLVYDKAAKSYRRPTYRDIVILLRATQHWAPVIIEELRMMGIPAYADLNTGYFQATEVQVMLSLLKVIDNPLQDIPLAGVLRSPIYRFTAEDLAWIRIHSPRTDFYEAVKRAAYGDEYTAAAGTADAEDPVSVEDHGSAEIPASAEDADAAHARQDDAARVSIDPALRARLRSFLEQLERWRTEARQGSLADLIWRIYRETGYYDLVGGLPGGAQRQANLRALYDRARTYESTSFRGLFRFLRFIERMQDSGADLGSARALGEQEDVVRIMSIHKSKGLEFPIVFVAGLAKSFNEQDLRQSFLLHKEWGLGPKFIDPERRISLPSLPWLVVRRRLKAEMLAEEMRILYVALTRAREKLILVAAFRDLEKEKSKWQRLAAGAEDTLTYRAVMEARCYADWIFPALLRHPEVRDSLGIESGAVREVNQEPSRWLVHQVPVDTLLEAAAAAPTHTREELFELIKDPLAAADGDVPSGGDAPHGGAEAAAGGQLLTHRFEWSYPHKEASSFLSKITVTEIKRLAEQQFLQEELFDETGDIELLGRRAAGRIVLTDRPAFMGEADQLTALERGTAYHTVMQHVPIGEPIDAAAIERLLQRLIDLDLLTPKQAEAVDPVQVATFFNSDLGLRMARAERLYREQPFSYRLPAGEVYREAEGEAAEEGILIQGVIDCLFVEPDGIVLVDYKTDRVAGIGPEQAAQRYDIQIGLYARAVADIWRKPVKETYLYFFDGPHLLDRSALLRANRNQLD